MEVYLVRHTSVDVPAGYAYGQTDVPVRPSFEEEAQVVKEQLAPHTFDKVWSSPLSRCARLAGFCGYPDAEKEERLKEIAFGEWEMKSWEEISADPRSEGWFSDWLHIPTPGGESLTDQYNRLKEFLDEIKKKGYDKVCIFAHGGILTCARVYAKEYGLEEAFQHVPSYGEVIKLDI